MVQQNLSTSKRDIIAHMIEDAYTKSYKMRMVGPGSLEATIPRAVVEREARRWGLAIEEFIKVFQVEYLFNDFDGAFLRFKRQPSGDKEELKAREKIGER